MVRALLMSCLLASCGGGSVDLHGDDCTEVGFRYVDADGDGFGDNATAADACDAAPGSVDVGGDCDDGDDQVFPGAVDECADGVDSDCDGAPDRCDFALSEAGAKLVGEGGGDTAGDSVSGAGDVDGDGSLDVLVGAPGAATAYVVRGPIRGTIDLAEASGRVAAGSEVSVAGVGDVDGDGLDDILVGDPDPDSASSAGAAYLVLGPATGLINSTTAHARIVGEDWGGQAGASVDSAGDVNGDGHADLLVGADASDQGGEDAGVAYLLLGPVRGDVRLAEAQARYIGEDDGDHAGRRVASAGDTDGDGTIDVLVGAPDRGEGGAVYLMMGDTRGTVDLSAAAAKLIGEKEGDHAGASIAGAGDMDGDGTADLLLGGYGNDQGGDGAGAAYLVLGPVSGTMNLSAADAKLMGERSDAHVGNAVTGAGDVDGDGNPDLLIGAASDDDGGLDAGAAYVLLGPVTGTVDLSDADVKLIGEAAASYTGDSVAAAGDMDGDGLDDVLVGASNDPEGGNYAGAAYLVLGGQW